MVSGGLDIEEIVVEKRLEDCGVCEAGFVFSVKVVKVFSECAGVVTDVELVISYPQGQADIVWRILGLQIVMIILWGL